MGMMDLSPEEELSLRIATEIFCFAEMIANGQGDRAASELEEWVNKDGPQQAWIRGHYLVFMTPAIGAEAVKAAFPEIQVSDEKYWTLENLGASQDDPHSLAAAQVLIRCLNGDQETAKAIIYAHLDTYREDGLFWLGVQSVSVLAALIKYTRAVRPGDAL